MKSTKFKPGQEVIVPDFLINGSRLDMSAIVQGYVYNKQTKTWEVEVLLNNVFIMLKEERLVDSEEFFKKQKELPWVF